MKKALLTICVILILLSNLFAQDSLDLEKKIKVLTPSEGALWNPGTTQTVEWTANNLSGNVNIKLSTDGGSTFPITLLADVSGESQSVVVPDVTSAQCVIRVESIEQDNIYGLSSGYFSISLNKSITVVSPAAGSKWIIGTEESVTWSSENVNGNIKILLSTDGGNSFPVELGNDLPNDGSESILVPDIPSTAAVIRVQSSDEGGVYDDSEIFNIEPAAQPVITVTEPTASAVWTTGTQQNVSWSSANMSGNVNIMLSVDGGVSFPVLLGQNLQNDGNEIVQVPDNTSSASVIRVESVNDNNIFGSSPVFRIESQPSITVSEPSASAVWRSGTQQNISWSSVNISGNLNIRLSIDGGSTFPILLKENIQNDGGESVQVPDNPTSAAVIKIESVSNSNIYGSSSPFKIESQPVINVTGPTSASIWKPGEQQNVLWSSVNITGNVNIRLSLDGGSTFPILLKENVQNDGSEAIQVPDNPSTSAVIKIESVQDNNIFGLSSPFKIESQPVISVTEPTASSVWVPGTQQNILWSSSNINGNVNIRLSVDGGSTFSIVLKENIQNDGSETIQVPDNPSASAIIRVESVTDNRIYGQSVLFKIESRPSISVTQPASSAKWATGTEQNVTWTSVNVTGNINIKLSLDGGITFPSTLKSNISNDGNETVQVPELISPASVIRVESVSDNSVFGNSPPFIIEYKPSIAISEPSESAVWVPGTQRNVQWSTVNLTGNVNIKLSVDGGSTFPVALKLNTQNDGIETIQVPDNASETSVIRIESAMLNGIFGLSSNFRIESKPKIIVTEPKSSSEWVAGTQQNVSWNSVNVEGTVNIKLSIDGGNTFPVTLKSNSSNDGTEMVDVPNNPSAACVIRVESSADNSIAGISPGSFSIIVPSINITSPSAGTNWPIGSRQNITWKSENLVGNVNIKLSLDDGNTFPLTLASNTKDDGKESITVPDNSSSKCVIKIESSAYNDFYGLTQGTFTISAAPQITITAPSDAANWTIGSQQTVSWTSVNIAGNVNIKLSTDGGTTFPVTLKSNTENDGNEIVEVPNNPSSACVIRIESSADNNIFANSEGTFTITSAPTISVTKPATGENWTAGTQQVVNWTSVNVPGNVNIKLSTDGGTNFPILLAGNIPNDGTETIQVPDNTSDNCRIKIEYAGDSNIFGLNPGLFSISSVPFIQVTQPAQAATWITGTQQTVGWNSENISGAVNILLSVDGGNTFPIVLKSAISNDGTEVIDVPDNPSLISRVKIESAENKTIFGLNPGNFIIKSQPEITVSSPAQGAKWTIGTEQIVSWSSEDLTGNINIKLSTDGGNSFPVILKSGTGNDGSEKISVPDKPSQNSRVKVESASDNNIFGLNPGSFTITSQPTITVTSPFTSVKWTIGSEQLITWTSDKVTGSVNIKLSTDGGNTFPVLLKSAANNDGSEKVIVPDNPSQACRIRIEAANDNSIFGLNPGNFTITTEPTITVTKPMESEKWMSGSDQTVSWSSVNVTGTVNILLSTDGGNTFLVTLKSGTANDGSEIIKVPENVSVTCRIRVESAADIDIFGLNPGNFEITPAPSITVAEPLASVVWAAGSRQNIVWNSISVTGAINIRLSVDGGITFPVILKSNTANDGSEMINVPSDVSQTCRIKVESAADSKIFGLNPGIFRITRDAAITLTSPEAQAIWVVGSKRTITWSSANMNGNINIKLSTDGGSSFPVTLKQNTPDDHVETIDVPNMPSAKCRIRIESAADNSIFSVSESDFAIISYPGSISINNSFVFEDFTDGKNYRIIGIPGRNALPISLSGEYIYEWQVFWDNGNDQDYLVSGKEYTFSPGKAYWIVSKNPFVIQQEVEPVPLNADNSYSIPLHPGWNLISNPFDQTVNWSAVRTLNDLSENQKLYYWNGGWDSLKSSMVPYEGYYFNNSTNLDSLKLPYQPADIFGKSVSKDEYPSNLSQFLSLRLSRSGLNNSEIFIGFDQEAKDDYDGKDYFAPPGDFQESRLSLIRKELPERERHFFIEQRNSVGEGQVYDIEIQAAPNELRQIEIAGAEYYNQYNIYLLDVRLNNFYNIKEIKKVEIKLAHRLNPFKLIIGTDEYIARIKQSSIPAAFELFQNYPNPFNPSTVIRFSLPEADKISLSVYNSIGELVEILSNEELYNAGNHEVMFNGSGLSSGVYIVDLRTSNFRKQNKMLLIK